MPRRNNGARLFWRKDRGAYSAGPSEGGAASYAVAQRIAQRLKSSSPSGSKDKRESTAQVIRLKS